MKEYKGPKWYLFICSLSLILTNSILSGQVTPPFSADFEVSEGYSLGALGGQNGWVLDQGQATVIAGGAYSGDNLASLIANNPFTQISVSFSTVTGDAISFADFYLKPKAVGIADIEEVVDSEGALIGFVKAGTKGETYVFDGDGAEGGDWLATKATESLGVGDIAQNWQHFTIRHDFGNNLWDLYIDGTLEAINLGLYSDMATYLNEFVVMGDLTGTVNFDLFSLTFTNPLFPDADKDGIKDAYESLHGLNPALNDRELDPDADGLTNVEEFLWGTFADNADTDGDTLNDGFEIENNRDPLRAEADSFILGDPQLFLWFKADTGVSEGTRTGYVSEWADQSGNDRDATQTKTNHQPAIVAAQANGYPVVRFDGANDRLSLTDEILRGLTEAEIFIVLKAASARPRSDKGLWRLGNSDDESSTYPSSDGTIKDNFGSSTLRSVTPSNDISAYHIYSVSSKADEWINRINGTVLLKSTTNRVLWKINSKIGRSPKLSFGGDFAEIIFYDGVLTSQERGAVLAYLSNKYNITVVQDNDGDGLPDPWERQYFSDLGQSATDDPDGDGDDNLAEYNAGTDPSDYYNGVLPTLSIASGNNQIGDTETYLTSALVVSVADANSNAQVNAPVEFSITTGSGQLAEDSEGTRLDATLTVKSDAQGEATAYVLLGSEAGETIAVSATVTSGTQNTTVNFEATVAGIVSSDTIIPGAVTAMGTAEVDAKVNDDQGNLKTVIMSGTGEAQIAVPLEAGPKVTFYSFIFRPSVGANTANPTQLNIAGAGLDFPRYANAENIMSGYIQVLDGASGGNNWIHTGIFYGLKARGEAKVPQPLTLRLDSVAGVWDLYFGDRLWLADLEYVAGADKIMISAGSEFYTTLGNISITKSNPLFVDINKDGLPDSFEIEQGYTPSANNREALVPGTTTSLLEHYLNTL